MKYIIQCLLLIAFLPVTNSANAQRKIESSKTILIEQEGDSLFCRKKETLFEVLDFEFDSCHFSNNSFSVTFQLINQTKQLLFVDPCYISWYDTNSLRGKGNKLEIVKPGQSVVITLESVPYSKKRMNSPGKLLVLYDAKELSVPIRLKQESSRIKHCQKGTE